MGALQLQPMVARRPPKEAVQKLSPADRVWLEQRLREYQHCSITSATVEVAHG